MHSDGGSSGVSDSERMNKSEVRSLTIVAHQHFNNVVLQRQDHECKSLCSATATLRITRCIEVFLRQSSLTPPYYCIKVLKDAATKSKREKRLKFVKSARSERDHRHPFLTAFCTASAGER